MRKLFTLALFSCLSLSQLFSQDYNLRNDCVLLADRCFRLTEDKTKSMGAFWSKKAIDLNKSFDLITRINFGDNNASGGDGLAFVICPSDNYINSGGAGSNFGAFGVDPALSVEFDNLQSPGYNDPSFDHCAIVKNNIFVHSLSTNLVGPVQTSQANSNIEDGKEHSVRFTWNVATKTFKVYVDCVERLSLQNDIVKNIFNNQNLMYWGFTGACGTQTNEQIVCIERASSLDQYNEMTLCLGETTNLFAAHPANGAVTWSSTIGLSNVAIFNPVCDAKKSTLYTVYNTHQCNWNYTDTVKITVPQLKPFAFPKNTELCEKQTLEAKATALDGKSYSWNPISTDSIFTISKAGDYKVTISDGKCTWKDSVTVAYNPLPKVYLGKDTSICANKNVVLNAQQTNATYLWSDGKNTSLNTVNQKDTYLAEVTSDKGCKASDTIKIDIKPIFNTTQKVEICAGDFFAFAGNNFTNDTTVCVSYNAKNACDSTHCITIKRKPVPTFNVKKDICKGDFFTFNTKKYFKTGIYLDTLTAKNGCDSLVKIDLNVIEIDSIPLKEFICEKSSYAIGNQTFSNSGKYKVKLLDKQTGCDSIVLLDLKVIPLRGFTGKDTICEGETLTFGTQTLSKSGFYEEKLKNQYGCDSLVDMTLLVVPTPKVKITTAKAAFCKDGNTTLFANATGGQNFTWNNGQDEKSIKVTQAGTYKVFVNGVNGCKGSDSIVVKESKPIDFDVQLIPPSCSGYTDGKIVLKDIIGGLGNYSIKLDKGNFGAAQSFDKLKENVYKIVVKDTLGCEVDTSVALLNPKPKSIQIVDSQQTINLGDSTIIELVTSFNDIESIVWTPNKDLEKINTFETWVKPLENTLYKITVKDSTGCIMRDSVMINVKDSINVFVPNVFSPNLDGTNDELKVFPSFGVEKILYFSVYDRWGNQLFEAKDFTPQDSKSWDGEYRNVASETGVYSYMVRVLKKNKKEQWFRGDVMLMR